MAPSLPLAAEIPWAVERYRVGKISPGMIKVVVLGPKFWKKLVKQYRNTKALVEDCVAISLSYPKPASSNQFCVSIIKETMGRTHDDEEDGQHDETHELDGFTTP